MNHLKQVRGLLFDLDGVLYIGSDVIDGAMEALDKVRQQGMPCRFITNTSTLSRQSLDKKLKALEFRIEEHEIISATQAALLYVQQFSDPVCHLLLADDVKKDFKHFRQSDEKADFVIIGDIGNAWSYDLLNRAFRLLHQGAQLIAIHKNRCWQTKEGLQMDIGAFVTALEYVSYQQAIVIGKPSIDFFQMATKDLQLPAKDVAIIGDDIESDIGGGQDAGLTGILVKTGKYRQQTFEVSDVHPDFVIDSVAELPELLGID